MSKAKAQGTRHETAIVDAVKAAGLNAWRLAEGGNKDGGDVVIECWDGDVGFVTDYYVVEAKATQAGNVTRWLAKAQAKAVKADLPFLPAGVVVWWRRLTPNEGGKRRTPDGVRDVVVMDVDTFLALLGGTR